MIFRQFLSLCLSQCLGQFRPLAVCVLAVAALFASGCCTTPLRESPSASASLLDAQVWKASRAALMEIPQWSLKARVGGTGSGGFNGRMNWYQDNDAFDISLAGPLSIGRVSLVGTQQRVEVTTKDENFITHSPETALYQLNGWTLPISSLPGWLFGEPGAGAEMVTRDKSFRPERFIESGWAVEITEWIEQGGYWLPRKIRMQQLGDSEEPLRLRYVLDQWAANDE